MDASVVEARKGRRTWLLGEDARLAGRVGVALRKERKGRPTSESPSACVTRGFGRRESGGVSPVEALTLIFRRLV